jgi:hypothetical protein
MVDLKVSKSNETSSILCEIGDELVINFIIDVYSTEMEALIESIKSSAFIFE